jgi:hypothetical protein
MRDDMLKEQLMSYARTAADEAAQPDAAAIRRRARRHYRRVAALTVAGVLVVAGVGVGLGLRHDSTTPTVNRPLPTVNQPPPVPPPSAPGPVPSTATTPVTGKLPATFVGDLGGRVVEVSTTTGKVVRTLFGPHPFGQASYPVGMSPDRTTVYFGYYGGGPDPCRERGVFRVPAGGGQPVGIVDGENAWSTIKVSADGSRLAYLAGSCGASGPSDVVVRDAGGKLVGRWTTASAGSGLSVDRLSLSPDGRLLAVPIMRQLQFAGVRVVDVAGDRAIADGRLLKAPDAGCDLVIAEFQPRTGRLAAFERCVTPVSQGLAMPRFRLVYLDPGSGRLQGRGFTFEDRWGSDLHVSTMDFDASGRHLLYTVSSADPFGGKQADRAVGTWRSSNGGRPVRVDDDRTVGSGQASQQLTTSSPSW